MEYTQNVLEYKCPCCGAGLKFGEQLQQMTCEYCDNSFEIETLKEYAKAENTQDADDFQWQQQEHDNWTDEESSHLRTFICQSCGGTLITDENTAATFCPYCENPAVLPDRLSGDIRPDAVLPFQNSRKDAQDAFVKLCRKKPLLPKNFASEQRVEKITGIYIPFWLYDCDGTFHGRYKATRVHHWSDSRYHYTKTDHYLLLRQASAGFSAIPMDASSKTSDAIMESIEPFDYSKMERFESAYLSGFLADKYDVPSERGQERIRQRVRNTLHDALQSTFLGYTSVLPTGSQVQVRQGNAKYVLLPVWMLYSKYKDKSYLFAMNGQTGKMTGTFPICPKRSLAWFAGICAAVTAIGSVLALLL